MSANEILLDFFLYKKLKGRSEHLQMRLQGRKQEKASLLSVPPNSLAVQNGLCQFQVGDFADDV